MPYSLVFVVGCRLKHDDFRLCNHISFGVTGEPGTTRPRRILGLCSRTKEITCSRGQAGAPGPEMASSGYENRYPKKKGYEFRLRGFENISIARKYLIFNGLSECYSTKKESKLKVAYLQALECNLGLLRKFILIH